jgi:hypothetical protein
MRTPRNGASYVMISDGNLSSLWTGDPSGLAPVARGAITYLRMTLQGLAPREWKPRKRPTGKVAFVIVGTADGEQIWEGLSPAQARAVFDWAFKHCRPD